MDANRIWSIAAVAAMIAILAGGWFLGVQPQLDSAAAADAQRAGIQQLNTVNEATLRALQAQEAKKDELQSQLAALAASVPALPQMPEFLEEVNNTATANGVVVSNVTTSSAVLYEPPATGGTQVAGAAPSSGSTPAPTATPAATPTPTPTPTGVPAVTNPLITSKNFVAIPVSFSLTGDSSAILTTVEGLQKGSRLFLVNGFTTSVPAAGASISGVEASVSGFVYVVRSDHALEGAG